MGRESSGRTRAQARCTSRPRALTVRPTRSRLRFNHRIHHRHRTRTSRHDRAHTHGIKDRMPRIRPLHTRRSQLRRGHITHLCPVLRRRAHQRHTILRKPHPHTVAEYRHLPTSLRPRALCYRNTILSSLMRPHNTHKQWARQSLAPARAPCTGVHLSPRYMPSPTPAHHRMRILARLHSLRSALIIATRSLRQLSRPRPCTLLKLRSSHLCSNLPTDNM